MQIVFGWHLDGHTFPSTVDGSTDRINSAVVGPLGFVELLESRMGLGYPEVHGSVRTAQYLARLAKLDDGLRYYSESFRQDQWAVAEYLLRARDTLVLHGWQRNKSRRRDGRLALFAELESDDSVQLSPGSSERFDDVVRALERLRETDVEEIKLTTPMEQLPERWRNLLERLGALGVRVIEQLPSPGSVCDSDLRTVQRSLGDRSNAQLAGDGSIVLVEADDEIQASEAVAAWLASDMTANSDLAIVCGGATSQLDQACHALGLPRIGGYTSSRWRSALQVLPLAFEVSWEPVDVLRLLELLTLPSSPIPRSVAHIFADALRREPGTGGAAWKEAWKLASDRRKNQIIDENLSEEDCEERVQQEVDHWKQWLESIRSKPQDGISTEAVLKICRRVQDWAHKKAKVVLEDSLFSEAAAQAAIMAEAVKTTGLATLSKVQLERILDSVVAEGGESPGGGAEVAPWVAVKRPGQLWGRASSVLWWCFSGQQELGHEFLWTKQEQDAIANEGVKIESALASNVRDAFSWRYPILNATNRVLLVKPKMIAGSEACFHPFWDEISHLWTKSAHRSMIVKHADDIYKAEQIQLCGRELLRERVEKTLVPSPRIDVLVPADLIQPRDTESASSLERLFGCPYSWVVQYRARINAGALISVQEDETLFGILAHRVVAQLFEERHDWEPREGAARASLLLEEFVSSIGLQLIRPGKLLEFQRAKSAFGNSIETLLKLIANAGLEVIGCELQRTVSFENAKFTGTIDMVLKDRANHKQIIDLKWTNWPSFRRKSLATGKAVQLAAYSWLENPDLSENMVSGAGFFMLKQGKLYHSNGAPFPGYTCVPGSDLPTVWKQCVETFREHMTALRQGRVIVTGLVEESERSALQIGTIALDPPCRICNFGQLCGKKQLENR